MYLVQFEILDGKRIGIKEIKEANFRYEKSFLKNCGLTDRDIEYIKYHKKIDGKRESLKFIVGGGKLPMKGDN